MFGLTNRLPRRDEGMFEGGQMAGVALIGQPNVAASGSITLSNPGRRTQFSSLSGHFEKFCRHWLNDFPKMRAGQLELLYYSVPT